MSLCTNAQHFHGQDLHKSMQFSREISCNRSCMSMFVFPCCPFVLPSCKIVSEVVHANRKLEGTELAFIILLAFVVAGMVNGEHSEAMLFNACMTELTFGSLSAIARVDCISLSE